MDALLLALCAILLGGARLIYSLRHGSGKKPPPQSRSAICRCEDYCAHARYGALPAREINRVNDVKCGAAAAAGSFFFFLAVLECGSGDVDVI